MNVARRTGCFVVTVVVVLLAYLWLEDLTARRDIRRFEAGAMGRMESAMWRSYYEGQWVRLGWQMMKVSREQFGFSWWDSLRMASHAAKAALYFRKNTDDPRCLPGLEAYYSIVSRGVGGGLDVAEAARLELAWWKERRQHRRPHDYAKTIAKLTSLVYAVPEEAVLEASLLRAEAMAYRDARRDGRMTESDWLEVARQLEQAYAALQNGLTNES